LRTRRSRIRAAQNKKNKWLFAVIIIAVIIVAVFCIFQSMMRPVILDQAVTVSIEEGATTSSIAQTLYDEGLIKSKSGFILYVKKEGIANKLRSGKYEFSGKVTLDTIQQQLLSNNNLSDIKVTIPEGLTMKQTAQKFAEACNLNVQAFLDYAQTADFPYDYLPAKGTENRLEGYLFPETYFVNENWDEKEIIDMLLAQFDKIWTEEYRQKTKELGKTTNEIIIMASLVEKEAKIPEDRPTIAGVFYNRLEKNMPLQSCATIQYLLGEPKARLLYSDLQIESPYNTYKYTGLPPGPIVSPGIDSIKAALYPQNTDYLYFLAKPDSSHYFSKTLAEHNAAKAKYIQ
jgi:UPF0755 protein